MEKPRAVVVDHDPAQEMVSPWMMVQLKGFFEVKHRLEKAVNKGKQAGRYHLFSSSTLHQWNKLQTVVTIPPLLTIPPMWGNGWIERRCLCLFFIDRILIILSLQRRRQGRGTGHVLSSTSICH
ncbi:hypothetical protein V6N13_048511 [Hibiscus sabdariffa]|uniref:Uncharacterized protein n=1 Tax=Hibiscus sabdariffa TaxID=183260 RepID=A0ABR2F7E9_9ROSI